MIFMECFGQLPYDVGYQKKHVRPHGEGWGLLLYPKRNEIKVLEAIFGECLNYKRGLRILIWPLEVPFFGSQRWALLAKVPVFGPQKMALRVPQSKF